MTAKKKKQIRLSDIFNDHSLTSICKPKDEMILYNSDLFQPFDELFEVAIHAAAKFTTEYKASETADEVDGVCDSTNEVCAFKTKQITFVGLTRLIYNYLHYF